MRVRVRVGLVFDCRYVGGGVTTGLPHMSTFCSCTRVYGNDCGAMMRGCVGECFVSFFLFCFI